jgi:lipoprotein-anchoring transpeptidase ErfK/SrfK
MPRSPFAVARYACAIVATLHALACGDGAAKRPDAVQPAPSAPPAPDAAAIAEKARNEALDRDYPLHGLVTGVQLKVRKAADPESTVMGWLRVGARVRLAEGPTKVRNCATGFYKLHPVGFACAGEGIEVAKTPPASPIALTPAATDAPLPYQYYFVKEPKVPEYHRLPSRDEQRESRDFLARYGELFGKSPEKAAKLMKGELPNEPAVPTFVRRFLDRGFFIAGAGFEERASRKFVRTVRGSYAKLSSLEERKGSSFRGIELFPEGAQPIALPVAWAVREAQPFIVKPRDDGSLRLVPAEGAKSYARLTNVPWVARERVGDTLFHKLADGHYVKAWFLALAEPIARPKQVPSDAPWVHVNLEQQTLVAYRGDTPVYATLVSSGLPEHESPIGLFEIRQKYVANGMSDLGPEAGDERYSIDDVPWTQYFAGSIALHGAFWHERFGLQRSHGCVNLAPYDAHRVWNHTWPEVGLGWHGATTEQTGLPGSKVLITKSASADDIAAALVPAAQRPAPAPAVAPVLGQPPKPPLPKPAAAAQDAAPSAR